MSYVLLPRVKRNAKELGLTVELSSNPRYKIEIYDNQGIFMYYGGAAGFGDFATYLYERDKEFAEKRKKAYEARHKKEIQKTGSRGWVIYKLLWT